MIILWLALMACVSCIPGEVRASGAPAPDAADGIVTGDADEHDYLPVFSRDSRRYEEYAPTIRLLEDIRTKSAERQLVLRQWQQIGSNKLVGKY